MLFKAITNVYGEKAIYELTEILSMESGLNKPKFIAFMPDFEFEFNEEETYQLNTYFKHVWIMNISNYDRE